MVASKVKILGDSQDTPIFPKMELPLEVMGNEHMAEIYMKGVDRRQVQS